MKILNSQLYVPKFKNVKIIKLKPFGLNIFNCKYFIINETFKMGTYSSEAFNILQFEIYKFLKLFRFPWSQESNFNLIGPQRPDL